MVSFRTLIAVAFAIPALAVTSPQDVSNNIKALTMKSQALIEPAQSLTIVNGPLVVAGQGPLPVSVQPPSTDKTSTDKQSQKIILGFGDIISTATGALLKCRACPQLHLVPTLT